ncbi:MAG: alpha/beta fold hydrolase [Undibacterium sp.]|nr:alpha/beta fold hydrolase [Undibacterium sp.]
MNFSLKKLPYLGSIMALLSVISISVLPSSVTAAPSSNTSTSSTTALTPSAGRFGVGFRSVQQYDYHRSFKTQVDLVTGEASTGEPARPMQTLIWYPTKGQGKTLSYGDYLKTRQSALDFSKAKTNADSKAYLAQLGGQLDRQTVTMLAQRSMLGKEEAAPIEDKFPVLIYAPGAGGEADENVELFEYLASHGYIVISSRSQGMHTKLVTIDRQGIETQAQDIQFLIGYARQIPQANLEKIAVLGFSWGGMANFFAASNDTRIKALISLDGSLRQFPEYSRLVAPESITVPTLFIQRGHASLEELNQAKRDISYAALSSMQYMDLVQITMPWMEHNFFTTDGVRFGGDNEFENYSRAEIATAYSWMARYVLEFMNANLKTNADSAAFLKKRPQDNGAPAHIMNLKYRPALSKVLPTREGFAKELAGQQFQHADVLYANLKKLNPNFQFNEYELNAWGYDLLRMGKRKESIEIFKFITNQYPNSFNAFDSLAEAYETNGENVNAIQNYQKSLDLNPKNTHAEIQLRVLNKVEN